MRIISRFNECGVDPRKHTTPRPIVDPSGLKTDMRSNFSPRRRRALQITAAVRQRKAPPKRDFVPLSAKSGASLPPERKRRQRWINRPGPPNQPASAPRAKGSTLNNAARDAAVAAVSSRSHLLLCLFHSLPILLFVLHDLLTSLIDRDVLCLRESCCSLLPRCLGLAGIPRH